MSYSYKPPKYVNVADSRGEIKYQFHLWNQMEPGAVTDWDLPYAKDGTREAEVVFILRGNRVTVRIDAWDDFATNLRCAALNIKDMRLMEARGSLQAMRETLMALPAGRVERDPWEVLEVRPSASPEIIEASYKALAKKYHPDVGGDPEKMAEINAAYEKVKVTA